MGKPPFDIPELRFVYAGVAVSHDQVLGNNTANTSSVRRTYLLEELIDTEDENFVKFVHNGNALPLLEPEDPLYEIAQFLCFTQHVQYYKTEGAVFLSDLQGMFLSCLWTQERRLTHSQGQKLCLPTHKS